MSHQSDVGHGPQLHRVVETLPVGSPLGEPRRLVTENNGGRSVRSQRTDFSDILGESLRLVTENNTEGFIRAWLLLTGASATR